MKRKTCEPFANLTVVILCFAVARLSMSNCQISAYFCCRLNCFSLRIRFYSCPRPFSALPNALMPAQDPYQWFQLQQQICTRIFSGYSNLNYHKRITSVLFQYYFELCSHPLLKFFGIEWLTGLFDFFSPSSFFVSFFPTLSPSLPKPTSAINLIGLVFVYIVFGSVHLSYAAHAE